MSEDEVSVESGRVRNVLTLNEKVAAIRRFEKCPEYRSLSRYFKCSSYQIKRIIEHKDKILEEWNNRTHESVAPTIHADNSEKEAILGKAIYEWIRRTMYFTDFDLTDSLVQTMAIEFKREMNLHSFFPHKGWIAKFRKDYDLKEVNTKTLNIGYGESHSVQARDIVRHLQRVCDAESGTKEIENHRGEEEYRETDEPMEPEHFSDPSDSSDNSPLEQQPLRKIVKVENGPGEEKYAEIDPDEPMLDPTNLYSPSCSSDNSRLEEKPLDIKIELGPSAVPALLNVNEEPETESPKKVINTPEEAFNCIKVLEEFALLKENYRLIGLIERLEEILKAEI